MNGETTRTNEKGQNGEKTAAPVQSFVRHVVHRLDPMQRPMPVVKRFRWLGQYRLVVRKDDGTFQKDWEYEFEDVD